MAKAKKGRAVDGIIVINKPLGLTSNQVLQRVKRLYGAQKAGHTGALDPLATGVLPICLGEATKLSQLLLDSDKAYDTTATLGEVRSTGDAEGEVIARAQVPSFSLEQIESVLANFRGEVVQVPPLFSALKLDGKPLYELARQGMSSEEAQAIADKKRRTITIFELLLNAQHETELELSVRCSKGTYIRTLVEDIGQELGTGAYVSKLHRTACGPFNSSQMHSLEKLEELAEQGSEALDALLLPPQTAIPDWPQVRLSLAEAQKLLQGQSIATSLNDLPSVQLWAFETGLEVMLGIGRIEQGKIMPKRLFQISL
ncbi:MAG: tRNA pseudouridine(55) synthase TruB [Venatoribacter sp.]